MDEAISALTPFITAAIGALAVWLVMRRKATAPAGRKEVPASTATARREQMFKKAFDAAPVGMALITPQGQWLQVNARLLKVLGYTRDEILRTSMRELTHSDDRKLEAPHARKLVAREISSYTLDKRLMRRGKQYGFYSVSFTRFQRADDTSEELWLCIVDEAKHAKDIERVEEQSAIEALLGEMREIAMITYDQQGIIQSWNSGAERVFGLAAKDILGRSRTVLYRESDVWEEKPRNDLRIAISNKRFDGDDWRVGKDGVNLWLKVSILPDVRGEEVVRFVEICRESGQVRGVDEYRQSYEKLKRASESRIEEMTASIRELHSDVERKEKQSESLREALESFRQNGEEQMAELKILTEAFRKEMDRRRDVEDQLRRSTAERDAIAQRFESAERELRERELVATDVPAEAEWTSLAHVPPADLFIALAKDARTGTLVVSSVSVEKKIFLEDGLIFSCTSNDPALFLGEILLREGLIDSEQHRNAVELHEETGIALGRILVMSGAIDQGVLTSAMRVKAEEEIVSIFEWEDGQFTFIDGDPPSLQLVPVRLDIVPMVLRGLRRAGRDEEAAAVERRLAGSSDSSRPAAPSDEDWGESAEAGISRIHEESAAPQTQTIAAAVSEEDKIVEQILAEAQQTVLDLAGLGDHGTYDPSLDDTQRIAAAQTDSTTVLVSSPDADDDDGVSLSLTISDEYSVAVGDEERSVEALPDVDVEMVETFTGNETVVNHAKLAEDATLSPLPNEPDLESEIELPEEPGTVPSLGEFVASKAKKSTKYHRASCASVANIGDDARVWFATRADAEAAGLQACKLCRKK